MWDIHWNIRPIRTASVLQRGFFYRSGSALLSYGLGPGVVRRAKIASNTVLGGFIRVATTLRVGNRRHV